MHKYYSNGHYDRSGLSSIRNLLINCYSINSNQKLITHSLKIYKLNNLCIIVLVLLHIKLIERLF